jgi:hypothetical protein
LFYIRWEQLILGSTLVGQLEVRKDEQGGYHIEASAVRLEMTLVGLRSLNRLQDSVAWSLPSSVGLHTQLMHVQKHLAACYDSKPALDQQGPLLLCLNKMEQLVRYSAMPLQEQLVLVGQLAIVHYGLKWCSLCFSHHVPECEEKDSD